MEFCEMGSVSDLISITNQTLTEEQLAVILHDVLKGLEYLHSRKEIHRSIKANNILLNDKGKVKLCTNFFYY